MNRYKVLIKHWNEQLKRTLLPGEVVELDKGYADAHRVAFAPASAPEEKAFDAELEKAERKKRGA